MNRGQTWISEIIPLDRPEYAKQPEALLTDLVWRSKGSTLSEAIKLTRTSSVARLVPYIRGSKPKDIVVTSPYAREADIGAWVLDQGTNPVLVAALLDSMRAPRARGVKSLACVPIHPDVAALQTLRGILNKPQPANVAGIIESIGWLGGSDGRGRVAGLLLQAMSQQANADEGLTGLVDRLLPSVASYAWSELMNAYPDDLPTDWPGVKPSGVIHEPAGSPILAGYRWTPFQWFWKKWYSLCSDGWYDTLPTRRFIDWATCLLRTGLSFAYLWEADFFVKLHACIAEEQSNQESGSDQTIAKGLLRSTLREGTALATIESPGVPATQKHAWNALSTLVAKGHLARRRFEDYLQASPFGIPEDAKDGWAIVEAWLASLPLQDLERLAEPLEVDANTAPNTQEFIRYLLLRRSADDDSRDQADFYYLARTNSRRLLWFQPGPEWLVVVTGLLGKRPGGKCTLGQLLDDLRMLGLRAERHVLVWMLEEAGLSTDSPDADNALVIQSGF
jgi:hypothetical protein